MESQLEIKSKLCHHCHTTKPDTDFYYYRNKKCKACCNLVVNNKQVDQVAKKANNKKYYLKHKARIIEHNTKYYNDRKANHLAQQLQLSQPI